ncbi:MAG TPA: CHAP domain-containing protein, partial [Ktedonobacterales bacterium]|nr:CHAP domain-containing protein [Ktedonobacterales bacterium]
MSDSINAISPSQARLLADLVESQMQAAAVDALSGGADATAGSAAPQGLDFASLLSSVLAMGDPGATTADATTSGAASETPSAAQTGSDSTPVGQRIATIAQQLTGDLRGANNRSFDPSITPQAAQDAWNSPGWGNGNVQCVAFVDGAYRQAGITLPAAPNATDFWGAYANRPGWSEVANGQGLPQPGDIIVMGGGAQGFGHVAIVTG